MILAWLVPSSVKTHVLNSSSLLWPRLIWEKEVKRQSKIRQLTPAVLWFLPASVTRTHIWGAGRGVSLQVAFHSQGSLETWAPSWEARVRSEEAKSTAVFWSFAAKAEHVAMIGRKSCQ